MGANLTGVAVLLLASLHMNAQQASGNRPGEPSQDTTNFYCAEKVQFPSYTPLARNAGLQGTLVTTVMLRADGTVGDISAEANLNNNRAQGVLLVPVEKALQKSQFKRECGGKRVILVFEFRLTGDPYDGQQQEVAFGYPNRFWITSRPTPVNVSH